ncbi:MULTISPECIES: molybdate ABC transporter substrate-binding protein [Streptomyces]|uniref:molybdate ABC transporter substrate-binding protein n=1 Tax=Streptomyces TaxID=1883 RepID=UPI001038E96C|nr:MULTISPECIES: molybdate ABC transporter substrate-binding protein [Streptomyces]MBT3082418.1 molybdate ABC transporter substrate-binding protein [Streptomyces sp. COG20]MBT3100652.1 molybdate ABC transporter substrate-binding protein [Streptomyces sp. CBG30]MBT3104391.1 molybdate ABC transporter substrate-binding protein [Streptomyces sp. COG19]MBT3110695.1 molybdate ABC transporter substrate-binding protein [Streptomyces sp. CYG20]MDI7785425.1 molybdate ABC transporter substrate-binding pr
MSLLLTRRRTAAAVLTAALLVPLAACGNDGSDTEKDSASSAKPSDSAPASGAPAAELTVLAAASLTDVFKEAGAAYEKENPGTKVKFSFAGSQELAAQVKQGAPADALVTADTKTMDGLSGETGTPTVIAKNRLVIAVGEGNPEKVGSLKDLADTKLKVVLAAPEVPVGRYSKQILDAQKIEVKPVSQEPNVRAVLSKVELGEADAGLVYKTDAETAPDKVDAIDIPDAENAVASYPAATLKASQHSEAAAAFVAWLSTPAAQKILQGAGFQQP